MIQTDLATKILNAAQVVAIPLLSAILAFVWDTWKKAKAVYEAVFGNPNVEDDRGLIGLVERHDKELTRLFAKTRLSRFGNRDDER